MHTLDNRLFKLPTSAVLLSIGFHILLTLVLLSVHSLDNLGLPFFNKKKLEQNVYQSFIQVDVVALPDQQLTDKSNPLLPVIPDPSKTPDLEAKDEQDEILEQKKDAELAKKKADKVKSEKLKADQEKALKRALEDAKREQALKALQAKAKKAGRHLIKGNILSQGGSSVGAIGTNKDRYTTLLTETIKQHFSFFSWAQKKGLAAEVRLLLLPNGRVKTRRVAKSSNDVMFDSAVLQAVDEAQPFPVPEDKSLLQEEITINFRP